MHKYISKLVVCVHRHNQKHIHARRHMWATQRHNSSIVSFYMHKVLQHSPNTHLPNLKHSSNTLHYSVLYQSINNLSPTHKHTRKSCTGSSGCVQRLPGSKVGHLVNTQTYTKAYVLSHTHRRSVCLQVLFKNACLNESLSTLLWSCPYACSLSRTLAGAAL